MANTVTQRTILNGPKHVVRLINIVSDGTEETDLVVYNNSDFINDTSKGKLEEIWVSGDAATITLEWDQTADSPVMSFSPDNGFYYDLRPFGGIKNPNGAGATGDLLLTSLDLDADDRLTIIIKIAQS